MTISRCDTYKLICREREYSVVREKKESLRQQGFRVKIRKDTDGLYEIHVKNVRQLDLKRTNIFHRQDL